MGLERVVRAMNILDQMGSIIVELRGYGKVAGVSYNPVGFLVDSPNFYQIISVIRSSDSDAPFG